VKVVGGEYPGYLPACDPDRITVEEVVLQVEGARRDTPELEADSEERRLIIDLMARLNVCLTSALNHTSIGQIVRQLYSPRVARRDDAVSS
ncbi:MAG TPA: hypothetical protein VHU41_08730, partial [Thermoanaerobaculia bacterium]|nr:hypothetical protein [Thermoanaerobaculia bacterium]